MGSFSMWHWLIVALVILVLFGRGKISETMGDFGKGIKSFRKGLSETDESVAPAPPPPAARIPPPAGAPPAAPAESAAAPDPAAHRGNDPS